VRTVCGHGEGGSSDADVRIFGTKNFGFFEIYGVSARTSERVESVRTFGGEGEGVNFSRFRATSFMDGP